MNQLSQVSGPVGGLPASINIGGLEHKWIIDWSAIVTALVFLIYVVWSCGVNHGRAYSEKQHKKKTKVEEPKVEIVREFPSEVWITKTGEKYHVHRKCGKLECSISPKKYEPCAECFHACGFNNFKLE